MSAPPRAPAPATPGRAPRARGPPPRGPPPRPPPPPAAAADPPEAEGNGAPALPEVHVFRTKGHAVSPKPGDVVTARVTRVLPKTVAAEILCVGPVALRQKFSGVIRQQDVRATEIDTVQMPKCFRPGDIVRAEVLALGDARSYLLSTAQDALGVVYAKSYTSGEAMVAVDWTRMRCPATGATEERKVAAVGRQRLSP